MSTLRRRYDLGVTGYRRHLSFAALVVGVALFIAGVAAWRMTSPVHTPPSCLPPCSNSLAPSFAAPYRLHPLRAELLWAASGAFALVALGLALSPRRGRKAGHPAGV